MRRIYSGNPLTDKLVDLFRTEKGKDVSGAVDDFVRVSVPNRQETVSRPVQMPDRKWVIDRLVAPGADHFQNVITALDGAVDKLVEDILSEKSNPFPSNPDLISRPEFYQIPVAVWQPAGEFPNGSGHWRNFFGGTIAGVVLQLM